MNQLRTILQAALMLLIMLIYQPSIAGCVDTFGIGAKATALGGAFAAYADDPFAAYYNPAGLTQIERPMLSLGTNFVKPGIKVYDYTVTNTAIGTLQSATIIDQSSTLVVPHIGYSMPLNKSMAAGIAIYVPYGMDVEWEGRSDNKAAYNCYHSWYLREVVNPTLAYRISERLSIGAGILLGKSESGVERLAFKPGSTLYNKSVKTDLEDDFNFSYNIGILYKPVKPISIGLTYRSRTTTKFKGTTEIEGLNGGDELITGTGITVCNTKVNSETEIDHPEQIQFGVRYLPHERLSLEADIVWTHWSRINSYTVTFDQPFCASILAPGLRSEYFPRNWENTTQLRFGIEWKITGIFALRASYFYDPSPIPDSTMDVQWPDADKKTYALGFGFNLGNFSIDGVIQYNLVDGKRVIRGESTNLNHSYTTNGSSNVSLAADGHIWGGGITVSYRF